MKVEKHGWFGSPDEHEIIVRLTREEAQDLAYALRVAGECEDLHDAVDNILVEMMTNE